MTQGARLSEDEIRASFRPITKREDVDGQKEATRSRRARREPERPHRRNHLRENVARKAAAKSTARKKLKSKGRVPAPVKRARPKQHIAISHYRDEDFKADGLRTYAQYRDLGVAEASRAWRRRM